MGGPLGATPLRLCGFERREWRGWEGRVGGVGFFVEFFVRLFVRFFVGYWEMVRFFRGDGEVFWGRW